MTAQRLHSFSMPDVGEGLTEADVLAWHVMVGDHVSVNQIIAEIETAKAVVELPSPFAGRVHELLVPAGVTVEVGTPIMTLDTDPDAGELPGGGPPSPDAVAGDGHAAGTEQSGAAAPATDGEEAGAKIGETTKDGRIATLVGYVSAGTSTRRRPRRGAAADAPEPPAAVPTGPPAAVPTEPPAAVPTGPPAAVPTGPPAAAPGEPSGQAPLASPPVRKLAKDLGVDLREVTPVRTDRVITRGDVELYVEQRSAGAAPAGPSAPAERAGRAAGPPFDPATRESRVPIKGVRKATADAMVASAFTAPHVTEFLTVDVSPMLQLRDRLRRRPEFADVKLTPLAFAARAVCLAARRTPEVNATWDAAAGEVVLKQYVNLGIAAATGRGLIVPVIRDADRMGLAELADALTELAKTARAGRTSPADMAGGTITITNVGVFGVDTGTPIINPGEAAILALGAIKQAPWVVDGQLVVRDVCQLALSFDHRFVDGKQGSEFLADVGLLLSDPGAALAF